MAELHFLYNNVITNVPNNVSSIRNWDFLYKNVKHYGILFNDLQTLMHEYNDLLVSFKHILRGINKYNNTSNLVKFNEINSLLGKYMEMFHTTTARNTRVFKAYGFNEIVKFQNLQYDTHIEYHLSCILGNYTKHVGTSAGFPISIKDNLRNCHINTKNILDSDKKHLNANNKKFLDSLSDSPNNPTIIDLLQITVKCIFRQTKFFAMRLLCQKNNHNNDFGFFWHDVYDKGIKKYGIPFKLKDNDTLYHRKQHTFKINNISIIESFVVVAKSLNKLNLSNIKIKDDR